MLDLVTYTGLALGSLGAAGLVGVFFLKQRRRPPQAVAQGFLLKSHVAEQLLPLTPEQHEAVRLYAWAEQVGWPTAAQNVLISDDFPMTKKAIT